jgi:putative restriction endonuclease
LEVYEGYQREQFVKHLIRERDKKLIKNYKEKYKSIQICPACNFNPQLIYDVKAIDLFEVHHVVPIGSRNEQTGYKTLEKDLILLCPNCHKFIHQLMINASPESVTLSMLKASLKS